MRDETFEIVKELIIKKARVTPEKVKLHAKLYKDIEFDSMEDVEFIIEIEEKFGIQIPDEEAQKIEFVEDLVNAIDKKVAEKLVNIA
jgi:acyl carrier protein